MSTPFLPLLARPRNRGWGGAFQMWYEDENGIWQSIERPVDWATVPYFLGINQATGLPTWMSLAGVAGEIVQVGFIPSALQLFPPGLPLPVFGGTRTSAAVLYPPTVIGPPQIVTGSTIGAGSVAYPPQIATPPIDLAEPWGEVARQETLSSGRLVISGLNLSGLIAVRFYLNGIRVTSDDSIVRVRLLIDNNEISTGYDWAMDHVSSSVDILKSGASDTGIGLTSPTATQGIGNASTESLQAILTLFGPNGSQPKGFSYTSTYLYPSGAVAEAATGVAYIPAQTGVVTGIVVYGSSDLVGGSIIALGIE